MKGKKINFCSGVDEAVELTCQYGRLEALKLLLQRKVDDRSSMGFIERLFISGFLVSIKTMHLACQNNHLEIVKLLIKHDRNGITLDVMTKSVASEMKKLGHMLLSQH